MREGLLKCERKNHEAFSAFSRSEVRIAGRRIECDRNASDPKELFSRVVRGAPGRSV